MTQADSVHSTPPINTSAPTEKELAARLTRQQRERERALRRLRRLREKATDEIERLIAFLDASDEYATSEQEHSLRRPESVDQSGDSIGGTDDREQGDDDELSGDENEPSLGFLEWHPSPTFTDVALASHATTMAARSGFAPACRTTLRTNMTAPRRQKMTSPAGYDSADVVAEQDTGNDEPSLGWTDEEAARGREYAGSRGNSVDLEAGEPARPPQGRTTITTPQVEVDSGWADRRLGGLTDDQERGVRQAMRGDSGVIIY